MPAKVVERAAKYTVLADELACSSSVAKTSVASRFADLVICTDAMSVTIEAKDASHLDATPTLPAWRQLQWLLADRFAFAHYSAELTRYETLTTPATTEWRSLLISDLGWSEDQIRDVQARLAPFGPDWDAPGMDEYDAL